MWLPIPEPAPYTYTTNSPDTNTLTITGYTDRYTQAQQEATDAVAHLATQHPERARELRRLLATDNTKQ